MNNSVKLDCNKTHDEFVDGYSFSNPFITLMNDIN